MTGLRLLEKMYKMVMSKKDSGQHSECETVLINHYGSTNAVVDNNNLLL